MKYEQFNSLVAESSCPVVLIEGTRKLPEEDVSVLTAFARWLAVEYPRSVSG